MDEPSYSIGDLNQIFGDLLRRIEVLEFVACRYGENHKKYIADIKWLKDNTKGITAYMNDKFSDTHSKERNPFPKHIDKY